MDPTAGLDALSRTSCTWRKANDESSVLQPVKQLLCRMGHRCSTRPTASKHKFVTRLSVKKSQNRYSCHKLHQLRQYKYLRNFPTPVYLQIRAECRHPHYRSKHNWYKQNECIPQQTKKWPTWGKLMIKSPQQWTLVTVSRLQVCSWTCRHILISSYNVTYVNHLPVTQHLASSVNLGVSFYCRNMNSVIFMNT
jgi:hypothetical protein